MVPQPDDPKTHNEAHNEEIYDQLISLIENTQGRLAPIIVACDDEALRQRIIKRYESEAFREGIRSYRIVLGQEPSMRSGLEALAQQEPHLQRGGKAVFTVTGAEMLLRVKLNPQDEQSELDKFFGYLQWTREGLQEFRYPIVLWVTHRILLELSRRSADFWSWRKAVLRFETESPSVTQSAVATSQHFQPVEDNSNAESLPPLAELQAEIAELIAKDPDAPGLATLYDRLGQVNAQRVRQGVAENLEQEREHAIAASQHAIALYQVQNNLAGEMWAVLRLGNFFYSQSCYPEAIAHYQKSLDIAQAVRDCSGEADTLNNLGVAYRSLGQHQRAVNFYQQSLEINRKIGDQASEATALHNLGDSYQALGQYQRAINFYQQSLEINQKIGDHYSEAPTLRNLGNTYHLLGQYQRAINFQQQSLEINREIGDRQGEATSLIGLGNTYRSLGEYQRAIEFQQQSLEINREIGNRQGEAAALGNLGNDYYSLGQHQQAIGFQQQSLEIEREIGNRNGEADALFNMANALAILGQTWEALQHYQQAKQIYQLLGLEHWVEKCDTAIYRLNQTIPVQPSIRAPRIDDVPLPSNPSRNEMIPSRPPISRRNRRSKRLLWVYGLVGLAIVLLIWWLKR